MSERTRQMMRLAAGLVLAGMLGCESTTQYTNPGALPMRRLAGDPKLSASTYIAHGNLLERQGAYERAADQYRKAVELTPNSVMARNRLGVTLNKLGDHAAATEQFRAAIRLRPDQASLHNNLGFSLYLENRYEEAAATLDQALAFDPAFRRARMNRGLVLAKMGDYEAAFKEFTLAGDEAEAYYNLAVIQADAGEYAEAARSLEMVRTAKPNFEEARDLLRQVSQLAAAQEAAQRAAAEETAARQATGQAAEEADDRQAVEQAAREADDRQAAEQPAKEFDDRQAAVWIGPVYTTAAGPRNTACGTVVDPTDATSTTAPRPGNDADENAAGPYDAADDVTAGLDDIGDGIAAEPADPAGGPESEEARAILRAELEQAVGVSEMGTDNAGDLQTAAGIETVGGTVGPQQQTANVVAAARMLAEIDRFLHALTGVDYAGLERQRAMHIALEAWINSPDDGTGQSCSSSQ